MLGEVILKKEKTYRDKVHVAGRIWTFIGASMLMLVPVVICIRYQAWPEFSAVFKGALGVVPIFWTVGLIEVFTYVPMLGTGGSYLGFMTGNLTNLKVPCALNAMQIAGVEQGFDEAEVISTISIAISAIVTTLIIALGVLLLSYIQPVLESEALQPAFDNLLPALFGGLGAVYLSKNFKIALAPLIFMIVLFVLVPSMADSVGVLVPVGSLIAIGAARILYRKNLL
jgi:hypothetical protein